MPDTFHPDRQHAVVEGVNQPVDDVDKPLVLRAQAGDQRAFEMLVVKYRRRIERLMARMIRDVNLVEDLAQETFIKAYRALPGFRGESAFYTWLYRIGMNTARKAGMRLQRDPLVSEAYLFKTEGDDAAVSAGHELADDATPESVLASQQLADAVNRAMDDLSDDLRQAILLREIEGMSYEQIAEVMGCPIGTVRSRIFRARDAIAGKVQPLLSARHGKRW